MLNAEFKYQNRKNIDLYFIFREECEFSHNVYNSHNIDKSHIVDKSQEQKKQLFKSRKTLCEIKNPQFSLNHDESWLQ